MEKYIVCLENVPPIEVDAEGRMNALVKARCKFSGTNEEWFDKKKVAVTQEEFEFMNAIITSKLLINVAEHLGTYTQEMKELEELVEHILGKTDID